MYHATMAYINKKNKTYETYDNLEFIAERSQ